MLRLSATTDASGFHQDVWKVLIYDQFCRDLISPLMNVKDLRSEGVTLHMGLHSDDRQPISEVPAIYFVRPNPDNIKRICADISHGLYDQIHLNFASSIPRTLLEEIAKSALEADAVSSISRVHDQYLNFISMEDRMFQFEQENSYFDFHDPTTTEARAEANISQTVDALFAVIVTLGVIPIIRCPRGDAAEHVAIKLDAKLRDHLATVGNLFDGASSGFNRPVLLLVDRNIDLSVMVSHSWSYQALIHDLLSYRLNRVKLEVVDESPLALAAAKPSEPKTVVKSFNLESTEPFWAEHVSQPITTVIAAIQSGVNDLEQKKKLHESRTSGADHDQDSTQVMKTTKSMSDYVAALPEIEERTRVLDVHTKIGKAILNAIRDRQIDKFFAQEETIMTKPALQHKREVMALINAQSGTPEDKMRLFLIYFLSKRHELERAELAEFEDALSKQGVNLGPLNYIKQIHAFNESWSTPSGQASSSQPKSTGGGMELFKAFAGVVQSSVQYLLPSNKDFHLTRVLDAVMELKETNGVEKFLYLDPKFPVNAAPRKNTPFKDAIVFCIGGGNYSEMYNIMDYAKRAQAAGTGVPKNVIYGTTELLNPAQFLEQITALATKK
jgi:hypothetical protein